MQPESHLSWLQGQRYTSDSALCHEHCSLMCLKPSDSAGFGHGVAVSLQEAAICGWGSCCFRGLWGIRLVFQLNPCGVLNCLHPGEGNGWLSKTNAALARPPPLYRTLARHSGAGHEQKHLQIPSPRPVGAGRRLQATIKDSSSLTSQWGITTVPEPQTDQTGATC